MKLDYLQDAAKIADRLDRLRALRNGITDKHPLSPTPSGLFVGKREQTGPGLAFRFMIEPDECVEFLDKAEAAMVAKLKALGVDTE